jgi:hypothetical protein
MTTAKTYGEAVQDPRTKLGAAVVSGERDRETVLADLANQGITGEAAWAKIIAEGLLR